MAHRDATTQLFYSGEYGRILEDARQLRPDARTDPGRTALIAQALFDAGDLPRAREWAEPCADSSNGVARARAQLVLAMYVRATGDMAHATTLLQAALRVAEEAKDEELEAWIAVVLLRHMFVGGRDFAAAMLPSTRAKAAKAGSAHVMAFLHATVAMAEGQTGRPKEAHRHLRMAQHLLASQPHAWLYSSILSTRAAIALAERDFVEAAECLNRLRRFSRERGLITDYARAGANIGNLAFLTGRYESADVALREALDSSHTSRIAKLSAAETLAQLRLSQGRLNDCNHILREIDRTAGEASLTKAFPVQWAKLTAARLLLRSRDPDGAITQLALLEDALSEVSDRALMAATRITAAQALSAAGDSAGAARQLAASFSLDPTGIPELHGNFYYAAASVVSDESLGNVLRTRARRLWAAQGTSALELGVSTDTITSIEDAPDYEYQGTSDDIATVEAVASLLTLGANSKFLGEELQRTIRRVGCTSRLEIVAASDRITSHPSELRLLLPQKDATVLRLACAVPTSPDKAVALGSILRVGQAALELEHLREAERLRSAIWPDVSLETSAGAIFESEATRDVLTIARRVANTSVPVLITGETGTGKEVLARLIHTYSGRSKAAFSPFNCTSTSRDMIESQLFGHRRGAFTGATDHSQGVIRAANHGTLLLDEVGDMPLEVQPKLLRFLESGEIHPLGESKPMQVDVRVIAATNVDLKSLVSSGAFREDLYYRLSIVPLHLPPLRERRGEIPPLATHYLTKFGREFGKGDLRLSEDAMEHLLLFRWPGNVRQLANEMRRVAALSDVGAIVMPTHLNADITGVTSGRKAESATREVRHNEALIQLDQPLAMVVEQIERAMIGRAMERANGVVEIAAKILGVSRKGLYLKRLKYQMVHAAEAVQFAADTGD